MDQGESGIAIGNGDDLRQQLRVIGKQLRSIRMQRGLSMQQVSARTGVSTAMISLVERGLASPSLTTLAALGGIYGLGLGDLFNGSSAIRVTTVEDDGDAEVARRVLVDRLGEGLRIVHKVWAPGSRLVLGPNGDNCTETMVVLSGELVMIVNGSSQMIGPGESVEFLMIQPVQFRNIAEEPAESIRISRC